MELSTRLAHVGDVAEMHRIRCRVRENRLSDPTKVTEASYLPYIQAGTAWVAESQDGIGGFAVLDLPSSSLWALFVAPESEGNGIGRALHDHVIGQARARGAERLWLNTSPGTRAEGFYAAAGWRRSGMTPDGEVRFIMHLPS